MKNKWMLVIYAAVLTAYAGTASARLPAPSEEEKAKAEAAKAKSAEDAEIEKAKLEKAQDKVVERYLKDHPNQAAAKTSASANDSRTEIPSAALHSRPMEKAGAYNESVTPQSAPRATDGTQSKNAVVKQDKGK
ncbi:MAG: hypothetical protein JWP36_2771 [Paucimonas sp.]|nr:hypothetical protein [Paucimonas sp.]